MMHGAAIAAEYIEAQFLTSLWRFRSASAPTNSSRALDLSSSVAWITAEYPFCMLSQSNI